MAEVFILLVRILAFVCSFKVATCMKQHMAPFYNSQSQDTIQEEYIIALNVSPQPRSQEDRLSSSKSFVLELQKSHPGVQILTTLVFKGFTAVHVRASESDIQHIRHLHLVQFIESNSIVHMSEPEVENKAEDGNEECLEQATKGVLWGLSRMSSMNPPDYTEAIYSYQKDDGKDVYAYVIDSGVYADHSDFQGRAVQAHVSTNVSAAEGSQDLNGHGTHVAGTIAGATYGVAKVATILAAKVLSETGSGTTVDLLEAILWVINDFESKKKTKGRDLKAVVNMSLGYNGYNYVVDIAVKEMVDSGLPVVISAGNQYVDACFITPARVGSAVTVGATTINDELAVYSNHGSCVDVLAPGSNILSTWIGGENAFRAISGTSMAAPHVTGAIARYLTEGEMPSPAEIKAWVIDQATLGSIKLEQDASFATPNRLLFMPCEIEIEIEVTTAGEDAPEDPTSASPSPIPTASPSDSKQDAIYYLVIVSVSLSAAMVFIGSMLIMKSFFQQTKVTSVNRNMKM